MSTHEIVMENCVYNLGWWKEADHYVISSNDGCDDLFSTKIDKKSKLCNVWEQLAVISILAKQMQCTVDVAWQQENVD